ncbi:MAG: pseudouridine synthase [Candidatus Cloacimonadota bacterium]|nr:MAG: pseudouridine synthase [Candidatus Cloacimonadota bacterium]
MRINKFLAKCSLGSRRAVEKLILKGEISVNGKIIKNLATQIDTEKDKVFYNNKLLKIHQENVYIIVNKPAKYLVTTKDPYNRKTIFDLLPNFSNGINQRLFPVGRLDYKSEGLLLLTNDGEFANQIIHPKYKLEKVYKVKVKGKIDNRSLWLLRKGIDLDGKKTLPAKVFINSYNPKNDITSMKITIYEGRNRQIRRMVKSIGFNVLALKRVQIGGVNLGNLPVGAWRFMKHKEIRRLMSEKHSAKCDYKSR